MLEGLIWLCFFIVIYTFIGYGFVLWIFKTIKNRWKKKIPMVFEDLPMVSFVVAAYNEEDFIHAKIQNSFGLNYPKDKIQYLFVIDGSDDGTTEIIKEYPQIELLHRPERNGKIAAIQRAMDWVKGSIVVFSDANTELNSDSIRNIVKHYADPKVGAVAGEKRVKSDLSANAASSEGFYWKYESALKQWDSDLNSVVGAAGELFSIRTELYEPVPKQAILDDFMLSLHVVLKGYVVNYAPDAYAVESSSLNVKEEYKRKVRIASGGIQSIIWLRTLLNPFKHGLVSFQYVSHRVLRWTVTPFALIGLLFFSSYYCLNTDNSIWIFRSLFYSQCLFYLFAIFGLIFQNMNIRYKLFFIPYYFVMMNFSVLSGMVRYFRGTQTVLWEKAKRASLS